MPDEEPVTTTTLLDKRDAIAEFHRLDDVGLETRYIELVDAIGPTPYNFGSGIDQRGPNDKSEESLNKVSGRKLISLS